MTDFEIGWTAGIVDGEGHLGIAKSPNFGVKVAVGNTDVRMLRELQRLWGGKIYFNANHSKLINAKPFWHWQIFGDQMYEMLSKISPFLIVKKDQSELLMEMKRWRGKKTSYDQAKRDFWRSQRDEIRSKLKLLTKRGIA